eukprot:5046499-Pleurochrysis_carterae.AAC.1
MKGWALATAFSGHGPTSSFSITSDTCDARLHDSDKQATLSAACFALNMRRSALSLCLIVCTIYIHVKAVRSPNSGERVAESSHSSKRQSLSLAKSGNGTCAYRVEDEALRRSLDSEDAFRAVEVALRPTDRCERAIHQMLPSGSRTPCVKGRCPARRDHASAT